MRPEIAPRTQSCYPLHHAPTTSTYSSPLHFSLGKWKGFAMEEEGILAQTHNVVVKYWGKGRILKWVEFLYSCASLLEWGPNTFFYRPKYIVTVGVTGYGYSNG
jgi:hypothetical protein